MSGMLDYKTYINSLSGERDVVEHFPSEQFTLPYSFNSLGSQGYTATITYQSFILDSINYTSEGQVNFDSSEILGYFPQGSVPAPSSSSVILPKDMYIYPMYPERTTLVPVTVVNYTFYKNNERFSRQLILIENWEPGMTIGSPLDHPDYRPITGLTHQFRVFLTLNTQSVITPQDLTITAQAEATGTNQISTDFFDNTATISIQELSTINFTTTDQFLDGVLGTTTTISPSYISTSLNSGNYSVTTGSFSATSFNFQAEQTRTNQVRLSWQRLSLSNGVILGGSTATSFTLSTTRSFTSDLVPITIEAIDTVTNTVSTTFWDIEQTRIQARAQLQSNYPATANQVTFYGQYRADWDIQAFVLQTDPDYTTENLSGQILMSPRVNANQVMIINTGSFVGSRFYFPNNQETGKTFTIISQTSTAFGTLLTLSTSSNVNSYNQQFHGITATSVAYTATTLVIPAWTATALSSIVYYERTGTTSGPNYYEYKPAKNWRVKDFWTPSTLQFKNKLTLNTGTQFTVHSVVGLYPGEVKASYYEYHNYNLVWNTATEYIPGSRRLETDAYIIEPIAPSTEPYNLGLYTQGIEGVLVNNTLRTSGLVPGAPDPDLNLDTLIRPVYRTDNTKTALYSTSDYGLNENNGLISPSWYNRLVYNAPNALTTGTQFTLNGLTYSVTSSTDRVIYTDPPWYNHYPSAYGAFTSTTISFTVPASTATNFIRAQITALEYSFGQGVPYYSGAYIFDRVKLSRLIPKGAEFKLQGNTQSPINQQFVILTDPDPNGWQQISPAYTISHPVSKPQWQLDNDAHQYFVSYEQNRDIVFDYDPTFTNQGILLACYGETNLIFDRIPYNLRVGATFSFQITGKSTDYTVSAIDAFRNILTVTKSNIVGSASSYDFIGLTTTFTNPQSPATTSTFIGTATDVVNTGGLVKWFLDRDLSAGTYYITATVSKNVLTGTNVAYVYPVMTTTSATIQISDGVDAGLYMTVSALATNQARVTVTSEVSTSRDPANFYTFDKPVQFRLNGLTFDTKPWVRQGTTFVQTATAIVVNSTVTDLGFTAFWPGSLDYARTSSDQILFVEDTLALLPASSTTVSISLIETPISGSNFNQLDIQGQVQILGTPYPLQTDVVPKGTITFKAKNIIYDYVNQSVSATSVLKFVQTSTVISGIATVSTSTANLQTSTGEIQHYQIEGAYSGDIYRLPSVNTSTNFISVIPNGYKQTYTDYIATTPLYTANQFGYVDPANRWYFNNTAGKTFLEIATYVPQAGNTIINTGRQKTFTVQIPVFLEPVSTQPWLSSLDLSTVSVIPWIDYRFKYSASGQTFRATYIMEIPNNLSSPQQYFNTQNYSNTVTRNQNYEISRQIQFSTRLIGSFNNFTIEYCGLRLQIYTPDAFKTSVTQGSYSYRIRTGQPLVQFSLDQPLVL